MIYTEVLAKLQVRKQRAETGLYNCLPLPFKRFRNRLPGIENGKYIILSANQKVGKSKLCDYMFTYETIMFIIDHPELRLHVIYFTLEESRTMKIEEFQCFLLNRISNLDVDLSLLRSVDKDHPCPDEVLTLLNSEAYKKYLDKFEEVVDLVDDIRNPTGINKYCRDYALSHGHMNYKMGEAYNSTTGTMETGRIIDKSNPYTPDDQEEHRIIIIDNASNISIEKGCNDKREAIDKLSKYGITLKNQLNYIFVLIQHQAQAQEGIENFKLNKMKPSTDGLADCKTTSRDCDLLLGLYAPARYGVKVYPNPNGYDISRLKNYVRFLEVIEDRVYGATGQICPLFFDGAACTFRELPRADDRTAMEAVYSYVDMLEGMKIRREYKPPLQRATTLVSLKNKTHKRAFLGIFTGIARK